MEPKKTKEEPIERRTLLALERIAKALENLVEATKEQTAIQTDHRDRMKAERPAVDESRALTIALHKGLIERQKPDATLAEHETHIRQLQEENFALANEVMKARLATAEQERQAWTSNAGLYKLQIARLKDRP